MKAEGEREHEMKAILCGWYVEHKRKVGKKRKIEVSYLRSFIYSFMQQTITKHLLSAWSRAGCWDCKDKEDSFSLENHLLPRKIKWETAKGELRGNC